ncbi:MAG: hypothetical protein QXF76_01070 [Candidatus Anstonellales archaeon]
MAKTIPIAFNESIFSPKKKYEKITTTTTLKEVIEETIEALPNLNAVTIINIENAYKIPATIGKAISEFFILCL